MDVDDAAGRIIAKLESRPRRYSFPKRLSLLLGLSRLAPALWQRALAKQDKTNSKQQPES
jgi:hypothetical protein